MNSILSKTFGGLSRTYYLRHLVFGSIFLILFVVLTLQSPNPRYGAMLMAIVMTLLYPYSRYVYESVMGFVMGNNVFFVNALVMLIFKALTMLLCWFLSPFIAPVGLLYLYWYHSKQVAQ